MANIKAILAASSVLTLLAITPVSALTVYTATNGQANATVGTGVNVNVGGSANTSASGSSTSSSNTSANTNANADLSIPLVVTQSDVTAGSAQPMQITASKVQSKSDLSGYIAAQISSDANLTAVDSASDHVAVTYKEPAMFLGVFPVSVNTTATTDENGNVTISKPWWGFLASSNEAALQSNVQSSVHAVLGANASASAGFTASQQAQLVAAIQTALSAAAHANASASATASGNVSTQ